ncbi:MAG: hypothetical protein GX638_09380 [Crenarchaeota archaeon]|nr:hypothetical protein [Thermoproteota archaeon]
MQLTHKNSRNSPSRYEFTQLKQEIYKTNKLLATFIITQTIAIIIILLSTGIDWRYTLLYSLSSCTPAFNIHLNIGRK